MTGSSTVQSADHEAGRRTEPSTVMDELRSPALDVRSLSKTYTTTPALDQAELRAYPGEVLGLLGANGAGKSTLLKIIAGVVPPTSGALAIGGHEVDFGSYGPRDAARAGIFTVYQELSVFSNISVAENFAMAQSVRARQSRRVLRAAATAALESVFPGCDISPRAETGTLSLAERQMVEIAVAASQPDLSVLILDEPTSALPAERADQLHEYLRERKAQGVLIIYVTHKLDDILGIADRLVVLRDGRIHWEGDPGQITRDELLVTLGARAAEPEAAPPGTLPEEPGTPLGGAALLTSRRPHPSAARGVELRIDPGEVVGFAGLEGAGQRPLLREIYATAGRRRSAFATRGGVAYVSGDRKREGLFALWSVAENLIISSLPRLASFGFVRNRAAARTVDEWYDALHVVASGPEAPITALSGGNQQKIIIARGFASGASLVLLDDPTRGVDIETKAEFYRLLGALRAEGRGAILYSTEDREFTQCDRVYVMAGRAIVHELQGREITRENIIHWSYAGGPSPHDEPAVAESPAAGEAGAAADSAAGRAAPQPAGSPRPGSAPPGSARAGSAEPGSARAGSVLPGSALLGAARSSRLALVTVLLVGMLIAMRVTQPSSMTSSGLSLLLGPAMPLVLAALAQMFIMVGGDFDVGIGYAVGLANVITATVLVHHPALGVLLLAAMIAGYAVMAVIVELTGVPAIVVTLGASFIWLGCGLVLQSEPGGTVPSWLASPFNVALQVIPEQVYLCAGLALVAWFVLRRWRYGVALRGFGNSRQAFIETGRSPLRARVSLYLIAGLGVVLAGALTTVSTTASDINASSTLTLISVAAVVIGGAEFTGGVVEPVGTVMAAVAFGLIPSLLYFLSVSPNYQTAVEGLLLVAAMAARRFGRGARSWPR
jgi:ribose transport system ATP-binding protein